VFYEKQYQYAILVHTSREETLDTDELRKWFLFIVSLFPLLQTYLFTF